MIIFRSSHKCAEMTILYFWYKLTTNVPARSRIPLNVLHRRGKRRRPAVAAKAVGAPTVAASMAGTGLVN